MNNPQSKIVYVNHNSISYSKYIYHMYFVQSEMYMSSHIWLPILDY